MAYKNSQTSWKFSNVLESIEVRAIAFSIFQAAEAADEALALYRHVDDTAGENLALEVIATFQDTAQKTSKSSGVNLTAV